MHRFTQFMSLALVAMFISFIPQQAQAQTFKSPVEYMQYISNEYQQILSAQWDYSKTVAHSKSAKKIEKRRQELLRTIKEAQKRVYKMPAYEGDVEFKNFVGKHLDINYSIVNDDYAKIVDMEAVAEQSYDLMEAYLLAKKMAGDKLSDAADKIGEKQQEFAKRHNIQLVEGETNKLMVKMEAANKVFDYQNKLYLIFFKSQIQEANFIQAQNIGDINAMEQAKNALAKYSKEGLIELKKLSTFNGDPSLAKSTKALLDFYVAESQKELPFMIDFFLKKENYNKLKTTIEKMPAAKRTQADVDKYNKAVEEFNTSVNTFNNSNTSLDKTRAELINAWNKVSASFLNKHVP